MRTPTGIIHDVQQGTDEWHVLRARHFTASNLGEWLIEQPEIRLTKKEIAGLLESRGVRPPSEKERLETFHAAIPEEIRPHVLSYTERRNLAWRGAIFAKIGEMAGDEEPKFETWEMRRGHELEPLARAQYEIDTGNVVAQVGFVSHSDGGFGCSPDGLVGESHGLEIKCHLAKLHARFLDEGGLAEHHKLQLHASMAVTGIPEWHVWGWHPNLPPIHEVVRWDETTGLVLAGLRRLVDDLADTQARIAEKWDAAFGKEAA